jgi:hypothetical protein
VKCELQNSAGEAGVCPYRPDDLMRRFSETVSDGACCELGDIVTILDLSISLLIVIDQAGQAVDCPRLGFMDQGEDHTGCR